MGEIYFSVDVEADGPIPGPYSMLSYGCAAYLATGTLVSTFTENLRTLEGATEDPDTMAWWRQPEQAAAWEACRLNQQDPGASMGRFVEWVTTTATQHGGRPVCVAYPAGFDFTYLYWYIRRFGHESPFSFSAIDIKTYAMAVLGTDYRDTNKGSMPKSWIPRKRHTHIAIDDAIEQGALLINILKARKTLDLSAAIRGSKPAPRGRA
jgi:hypothetical protein